MNLHLLSLTCGGIENEDLSDVVQGAAYHEPYDVAAFFGGSQDEKPYFDRDLPRMMWNLNVDQQWERSQGNICVPTKTALRARNGRNKKNIPMPSGTSIISTLTKDSTTRSLIKLSRSKPLCKEDLIKQSLLRKKSSVDPKNANPALMEKRKLLHPRIVNTNRVLCGVAIMSRSIRAGFLCSSSSIIEDNIIGSKAAAGSQKVSAAGNRSPLKMIIK